MLQAAWRGPNGYPCPQPLRAGGRQQLSWKRRDLPTQLSRDREEGPEQMYRLAAVTTQQGVPKGLALRFAPTPRAIHPRCRQLPLAQPLEEAVSPPCVTVRVRPIYNATTCLLHAQKHDCIIPWPTGLAALPIPHKIPFNGILGPRSQAARAHPCIQLYLLPRPSSPGLISFLSLLLFSHPFNDTSLTARHSVRLFT